MYLLANGTQCKDLVRKSMTIGNYTLAILEQGSGFRISLIDNRNKCEVTNKFTFDYDKAVTCALNTAKKLTV